MKCSAPATLGYRLCKMKIGGADLETDRKPHRMGA